MRFSLRTLLTLSTLGPPVLAGMLLLPLYLTPGQTAFVVMTTLAVSGVIGCVLLLRTPKW